MATVAVATPSYARAEPGSYPLRIAQYPESTAPPKADVQKIATEWVDALNKALSSPSYDVLDQLFLKDSCWRDQLGLSWNYHTFSGPENIISFLKSSPHGSRIKKIRIDDSSDIHRPNITAADFNGKVTGVGSFLTIETDVGRGPGIVRLMQDEDGKWKAFTLFTAIHELHEHKEMTSGNRPDGVIHGSNPGRKNWQEMRTTMENFEDDNEPTVLILGAGQSGLTSAARLQNLGVPTLIIDRNPRVGDNWRNRYHQLVLHDPVWYDHLPYVPFPSHWPVFTPKDKLAEWFESYVRILELNVWTETNIESAKWDESKRQWTVDLKRKKADGTVENRTFHPRHIIQATGHSGEMNLPQTKGMENFKGSRLCHSSKFEGAKPDAQGQKAVVVGCCNSGHDIAQDFYEHGYDVTIVQRSSTYVLSSKSAIEVLLKGLYEEGGPPTEDADLLFMSIPNPVLKRIHVDATKEIARRDADLLAGLEKVGFKTDTGPDQAGFFMKYFQRGGGYYIDVGCSQLIIDGEIKLKQGCEIAEVKEHSLLFDDGTELEADEIVFATGYENMKSTARKVFGDEVADRLKDVWGFDEEGELRTMWRKTGHPGFWFFGGNLALCRYYSRMLALQIKAMEEGIMKYEDP